MGIDKPLQRPNFSHSREAHTLRVLRVRHLLAVERDLAHLGQTLASLGEELLALGEREHVETVITCVKLLSDLEERLFRKEQTR